MNKETLEMLGDCISQARNQSGDWRVALDDAQQIINDALSED